MGVVSRHSNEGNESNVTATSPVCAVKTKRSQYSRPKKSMHWLAMYNEETGYFSPVHCCRNMLVES